MHECAHSRTQPGRACGFSLIELMMVMAIMATVAAIAAPRYARSLARYRVEMAAKQIAADLALLQSSARMASAARTVTFDIDRSAYVFNAHLQKGASSIERDLQREPFGAAILSANFDGAATLIYNGYGVPSSGGSIVVQAGGVKRTIIVNKDSGAASIE